MTYIPNTMIEKKRFLTIFRQMTSMEGSASPVEVLVKLQTDEGIDKATAEANALRCMAAVAGCEAFCEQLSDDAMATMDRLFEKLAERDPGERAAALYMIHFGLTSFSKPDFTITDDLEKQFQDYLKELGGPFSPEEMEQRIRLAMQRFHISPTAMRMLARRLRSSTGCLATAMALGENGRNLKCLMTMDLWLNSQGTMSMEDAANTVSAGADFQAVADAVTKGFITREAAKHILLALSVILLMVGIFHMVSSLDALVYAAEHFVAEGAAASATSAAGSAVPSFGSVLVNYGDLFTPTPADHLATGISDGIKGLAALFGSKIALTKKAADMAGAAGCYIAGLFQSADAGADAMENLADAMEAEAAATAWDAPDVWTAARSAGDAIAEEDDEDPVNF